MMLERQRRYNQYPRLSISEAIASGVPVYWTGESCKNGHIAPRYVSCKKCVICSNNSVKKHGAKRIVMDGEAAGIHGDVRRKTEELLESLQLKKDLGNDYL